MMNPKHRAAPAWPSARRKAHTLGATLSVLGLTLACLAPGSALAKGKLADDLQAVVDAGGKGTAVSWVSTGTGTATPLIKAVVVSNSSDPDMTDLRAAVLANGGSVYAR